MKNILVNAAALVIIVSALPSCINTVGSIMPVMLKNKPVAVTENKYSDLNAATDRLDASLEKIKAQDKTSAALEVQKSVEESAPHAIASTANSLDRSEPSITEMLAVFDDAQLDAIAENATKYSDDVSPAELVSYFKPELKSIVHKLVFDSRERSPLSAEQKQYMVDTQVNRARDAVSRAVAKKHS